MATYTDYKLDSNGDYVIENGAFVFVEDREVILQNVETALNLYKKDWFLNFDEGITYYDNDDGLFGTRAVTVRQEAEITNIILNVEGVELLESISFDLQNNELTVNCVYMTIFGQREEQTVNVSN